MCVRPGSPMSCPLSVTSSVWWLRLQFRHWVLEAGVSGAHTSCSCVLKSEVGLGYLRLLLEKKKKGWLVVPVVVQAFNPSTRRQRQEYL